MKASKSSESAKTSLTIAKALKTWSSQPCSMRKSVFKRFANELVNSLCECFQAGQVKSLKKRRERMWESYHKLRCSSSFKLLWSNFLFSAVAGCQAEPTTLYQYLTDRVMEMLIQIKFPVTDRQDHKVAEGSDVEEKYALRYAAGYVVRALKMKVKQSGHPMKKELQLCLSEMVEEDASECVDESDNWTTAIDREGLIHVSNLVYQVFADMELTLRTYLKHRPDDVVELSKVKDLIVTSEDVQFGWSIVSINWGMQEANVLLNMITEQWLTLRGFSLASAFIEEYKQHAKKNVQKTKGIRKQLQTHSSEKDVGIS